MSFETLGLAPTLLSALQEAGFSAPTPVQAAAIPQALAGHDLMVSSQTGSGKTAAFMLPALNRIVGHPGNTGVGVQVLVLTNRKRVVSVKSVSVRVDLGGRSLIKTTTKHTYNNYTLSNLNST